ncbi:MAG: Hpt domain-containing protein [Myxococcaceae bacterium]|nr:Hpt domain-containing protein [Myxococcaceae bacterium]
MEPIDWKALSENCAGDDGLVTEIVGLFRREAPALLGDVQAAVRANDGPAIKRTAHRLKGALLSLAAKGATELAKELEQAGSANELSKVTTLLSRLEEELRRVLTALDGR